MKPLISLFLLLLILAGECARAATVIIRGPLPAAAGSGSPAPDIAWWKMNEGTGTSVADASGNGRTLTLSNSGMWATVASFTAIQGNGSSFYANSASTINFATNKITLCFWFYTSSFANDDKLAFELSVNVNSFDHTFYVDPNASGGTFDASIQASGNRTETWTRPSAAAWHHFLIVLDNSTNSGDITVYTDGSSTGTTVALNSKSVNANFRTDTLYVLSRGGSSLFSPAALDDVRIYTGDRSANVAAIYADRQ